MKSYCIQDNYPEQYCHCYGCGRKNRQGLKIKSYWDGQKATARFTPAPHHIALPGYVYGGLIASLIDCHGIAAASAAMAEENDRETGYPLLRRYVTASLRVDYLKPTPMGVELEMISAGISPVEGRVLVEVLISAKEKVRVRGRVTAAPMPVSMA